MNFQVSYVFSSLMTIQLKIEIQSLLYVCIMHSFTFVFSSCVPNKGVQLFDYLFTPFKIKPSETTITYIYQPTALTYGVCTECSCSTVCRVASPQYIHSPVQYVFTFVKVKYQEITAAYVLHLR